MTDTASGWTATHRTPREGIDTWTNPDPIAPPASELDGHVEVQLIGTAGEWAQVRGANGWEGWLDGRLLEQVDGSGAPTDQRAYLLLAVWLAVIVILAVTGWAS